MTNPALRAFGRALAAALIAGLLGAACAALFFALRPELRMEFDKDPPKLVSGLYPVERDERTQVTFAWTGAEAALRLPGLDRHVAWTLVVRVRGGRARPAENPQISIHVDGVQLLAHQTGQDFEDVRVAIPAHPEQRRGAVVIIRSSSTFVPGPSDPRPLGVMLDRLSLSPDGAVLPPRAALGGAAASSACMGAAIALLGVTAGSAIGGAVLVSVGTAAIIARGFAPFTTFPAAAVRLGFAISLALVVLSFAVQGVRRQRLRNTARFAAAFSAAALFLKLLVLLHPDMPIGDALFHAHRFQGVLAGQWFFTSVAPGGYAFPYAPGFYVFASAFAGLVHRGAGDVSLLRIITSSADAAAGLLLYSVVVRAWKDRLAGAISTALYQLIPLDFGIMTIANLTNAFAQALAVSCFALVTAPGVRADNVRMTAGLTALLTAAYLSHLSTFATLFVATFATAMLFALRGGTALRSGVKAVLIASTTAAVLALVLYYAHFIPTYESELMRLSRETAIAAPDAGGRSIAERASAVPMYLRINFGVPILLLTALGAWQMALRGAADRLTLTIAGWALSCLMFLSIGILTPVDMRYYLAAIPAVAVTAAAGAARGWQAGARWRAVTGALLAGAAIAGVRNWWGALVS